MKEAQCKRSTCAWQAVDLLPSKSRGEIKLHCTLLWAAGVRLHGIRIHMKKDATQKQWQQSLLFMSLTLR